MFLRKKLGAEKSNNGEGAMFCYVNSVFAPGLDEGVGNLWRVSRPNFLYYILRGGWVRVRGNGG